MLAAPAEPGAELAGEIVLAELLALRSLMLMLNLHFRADKGPPTEAEMRRLIERIDGTKIEYAEASGDGAGGPEKHGRIGG